MKQKIGGIIGLSGFLVNTAKLIQEKDSLYTDCPILLMHGDEDQTIFPVLFFEAQTTLEAIGFKNVQTKLYHLGHTINYEQIQEIKSFLKYTSV